MAHKTFARVGSGIRRGQEDENATTLVFWSSLSFSFPHSSSATGDNQSAIIRPRNCSERHFLAPFLDPLPILVCPFYIVSIAHLPVSNHPYITRRRILSSLPLGLLFNHLMEYDIYSCDREICDQTRRLECSRKVEKGLWPKEKRRESDSFQKSSEYLRGQHKASQTMPEDLDSWRDQNGQANHRRTHPSNPPRFAFLRMHTTRFWFYGREWAEKRSSKNKKK